MAESFVDDVRLLARGWRWGRRRLPLLPYDQAALATMREPSPPFATAWARWPSSRLVRGLGLAAVLPLALRSVVAEVRVGGRDQLERAPPPVVFVANHASHLDALLVLHALPPAWRRRTVVAAAADYFFTTWWRSALAALALNAVPLERRPGTGGAQAQLAGVLADGWSVLTFPEGTRSRDGGLQRFHLGPARLALDQRRPLVPIGIRGTFQALPAGASWPQPARPTGAAVAVRFGPPLLPAEGERAAQLTARARAALLQVLDEDTTTWWHMLRHPAEAPEPGPAPARWRRVWQASRPLPQRPPHIWERD
jgi:1-acyl-sn-glycerol-3-phosphate acyltransferase